MVLTTSFDVECPLMGQSMARFAVCKAKRLIRSPLWRGIESLSEKCVLQKDMEKLSFK